MVENLKELFLIGCSYSKWGVNLFSMEKLIYHGFWLHRC